MNILEIVFIGFGVAMDAFAAAICKGLSMKKFKVKHALIIALYFGLFQAFMPALGYLLGGAFATAVEKVDHWIAFFLLTVIGINMIRESFSKEKIKPNNDIKIKEMLLISIATSIDALAVGVSFAFLKTNVYVSIAILGTITFILAYIGVMIGNKFGSKYKSAAELIGGIILILIGLKILLEHLGVF